MSSPLSTPATRQPLGNDWWYLREKTADAVGSLNTNVTTLSTLVGIPVGSQSGITGNLSFGDISTGVIRGNLQTQMFQGTSPATANTAFTFAHGLGKIPNGAILIQSDVAAILYGNAVSNGWTSTTITLLFSVASVAYTILVI